MPGFLELEPERGLQVTRIADDGRNLTHLRIADGRNRISELRMIEHIERFDPELQDHLLMDGESLKERRIKVCPPWTNQRVTARVTVGVGRRSAERRGAEPVKERLRVGHRTRDVRTAGCTGVGGGGLQNR